MALFRPGALLHSSPLYDLAQRLAGKSQVYTVFVREYLSPSAGARMLDIGCGTGGLLMHLPPVTYLGIDVNADYIATAQRRHGGAAAFAHADLREIELADAAFDYVVAPGVLHHLDDRTAAALGALARRAIAPGGRFVLLEPCRLKGQPLLAKAMIALDRGAYVRDVGGYDRVLRVRFGDVRSEIRDDLLPVPLTHAVFDCRAGTTAG